MTAPVDPAEAALSAPVLAILESNEEHRQHFVGCRRLSFRKPGTTGADGLIVFDLHCYESGAREAMAAHITKHSLEWCRVHDGDVFALELLQPGTPADVVAALDDALTDDAQTDSEGTPTATTTSGRTWQQIDGGPWWFRHVDGFRARPDNHGRGLEGADADNLPATDVPGLSGWSLRLTAPCGGTVLLDGWGARYPAGEQGTGSGEPGVADFWWDTSRSSARVLVLTPAPLSRTVHLPDLKGATLADAIESPGAFSDLAETMARGSKAHAAAGAPVEPLGIRLAAARARFEATRCEALKSIRSTEADTLKRLESLPGPVDVPPRLDRGKPAIPYETVETNLGPIEARRATGSRYVFSHLKATSGRMWRTNEGGWVWVRDADHATRNGGMSIEAVNVWDAANPPAGPVSVVIPRTQDGLTANLARIGTVIATLLDRMPDAETPEEEAHIAAMVRDFTAAQLSLTTAIATAKQDAEAGR